jgi:hypothetical protein
MHAEKNLCFTHYELLTLTAIVRSHKHVAEQKNEAEEAEFMQELLDKLLTFNFDKLNAYLTLANMTCFALWMCVETYIEFCKQSDAPEELEVATTIHEKLAG